MKDKAEWLSHAVSGKCEIIPQVIEDEDDPAKTRSSFETILKEELQKKSRVLVNITCGTKLMAITAARVCERLGVTYVYVTLDNPEFLFFTSMEVSPQRRELNPNLKDEWVERYLAAHGVSFDKKGEYLKFWEKPTQEQKKFFEFIFRNTRHGECVYRGAIVTLSRLKAIPKESYLKRSLCNVEGVHNEYFHLLLDELERLKMIKRNDTELEYRDDKSYKFFTMNRWFELYTANQLMELGMGIRPFTLKFHKSSTQQEDKEGLVKNELDVAFFFRGRLNVIEVKSGLAGTQGADAQSTLHKVSNVSNKVGGIACRSAIASWYPMKQEQYRRGIDEGTTVFSGDEVINPATFQKCLRDWLH